MDRFLGLSHSTTLAAVTTNKNIIVSSCQSSENIKRKSPGQNVQFRNNEFSSMALGEMAMKSEKAYCNFEFLRDSQSKDI